MSTQGLFASVFGDIPFLRDLVICSCVTVRSPAYEKPPISFVLRRRRYGRPWTGSSNQISRATCSEAFDYFYSNKVRYRRSVGIIAIVYQKSNSRLQTNNECFPKLKVPDKNSWNLFKRNDGHVLSTVKCVRWVIRWCTYLSLKLGGLRFRIRSTKRTIFMHDASKYSYFCRYLFISSYCECRYTTTSFFKKYKNIAEEMVVDNYIGIDIKWSYLSFLF